MGMFVWAATRAISSTFSGGTGSSKKYGSNSSRMSATRIATAVENWPWVPIPISSSSPTSSRMARKIVATWRIVFSE